MHQGAVVPERGVVTAVRASAEAPGLLRPPHAAITEAQIPDTDAADRRPLLQEGEGVGELHFPVALLGFVADAAHDQLPPVDLENTAGDDDVADGVIAAAMTGVQGPAAGDDQLAATLGPPGSVVIGIGLDRFRGQGQQFRDAVPQMGVG